MTQGFDLSWTNFVVHIDSRKEGRLNYIFFNISGDNT